MRSSSRRCLQRPRIARKSAIAFIPVTYADLAGCFLAFFAAAHAALAWQQGTRQIGTGPHSLLGGDRKRHMPRPQDFLFTYRRGRRFCGLKAELRAPKVISEYVRAYLEERKRLAAASNAKRQRLEQQQGQLTREIDRLVNAIAKGHVDPAVLGPPSTALAAERTRISEELTQPGHPQTI